MSEQEILYRLAEDVGGLKRDVENHAKTQAAQWDKLGRTEKTINSCDRKLDLLLHQEQANSSRLKDTEEGVKDYRRSKSKVLALISGIGIGVGGLAGGLVGWISKLFSGNG